MRRGGLVIFVVVVMVFGWFFTAQRVLFNAYSGTGEYSSEDFEKGRSSNEYVWQRDFVHSIDDFDSAFFETVNGGVTVEAHEDPSIKEIRTHATIKIRGSFFSSEEKILSAKTWYDVVEKTDDRRLDIRAQHPRRKPGGIGNVEISLAIKTPAGLPVDAKTVNGGVKVVNLTEVLKLTTVNGKITASGCAGSVHAHTVNGGINIDGLKNGLKAETVNGSVDAKFAAAPSTDCSVNTVNGGVKLSIPKSTGFNVRFNTNNGGIRFSDDLSSNFSGQKKKNFVEGAVNAGGPTFHMKTVNGGIAVQSY